MTINYITKDGKLFDQALQQELITKELETTDLTFLAGGKNFTLTTLSASGYQPHSRTKGFNEGSYANEKEVYSLDQDRDIEFYVDAMDVEETNQDLSVANITKTFQTENAVPEVDAYRFMTLAKVAIANDNAAKETLTKANIFSKLKAALLPVRKFGPANIIIYVSSQVMDALEQSTEFTRSITNQNVGMTALESRITSLDGVIIKEVWDAGRFYTDFELAEGHVPKVGAFEINFLLVAKPAQISAVKHQAIFLFAPGNHTQGDGFLYQNRLYHGTIVKKEQLDGIVVSYGETAVV